MVLQTDRLKWKLISVRLEIMLILTQDRSTVCVERTIGSKTFWTHLMELQGDVGHLESRFFLFGDSVNIGAWFALDIPYSQKSFWTHQMVLLGDEAQVEARFGPIEHSANLNARLVHGSCLTYHRLGNHFGRTRWNS